MPSTPDAAQDGHGCDILVPVRPADEVNNHGYYHASKPERGLDLRQLMAKRLGISQSALLAWDRPSWVNAPAGFLVEMWGSPKTRIAMDP